MDHTNEPSPSAPHVASMQVGVNTARPADGWNAQSRSLVLVIDAAGMVAPASKRAATLMSVHPTSADPALDAATRTRLEQGAARAEFATIGWNVMEMFATIGLGIAARSLALIAFGMDSMIEVFASSVVVWHLRHPDRHDADVTAWALRLVAAAFFLLAVVLVVATTVVLLAGHTVEDSPLGVAYLTVTALVMLSLALVKRRIGVRLGSRPLTAEARMTFLDAALATSVLLGLVANGAFGWWWADPAATMLVAGASAFEGIQNLQEAAELDTGG